MLKKPGKLIFYFLRSPGLHVKPSEDYLLFFNFGAIKLCKFV